MRFRLGQDLWRLEGACTRALAHDSPHYATVKSILKSGADRQPLEGSAAEQVYSLHRFLHSAASLFAPIQPELLH